MPSIQNDDCFILNLPNEILCDIVSYALPYKHERFTTWDRRLTSSPFHCVRAICRLFRAIVAELRLWWTPDFDIFHFKPYHVDYIRFLNDLLTDPDIVKALGQRTEWYLVFESFEQIIKSVPSFRENVAYMVLSFDSWDPTH